MCTRNLHDYDCDLDLCSKTYIIPTAITCLGKAAGRAITPSSQPEAQSTHTFIKGDFTRYPRRAIHLSHDIVLLSENVRSAEDWHIVFKSRPEPINVPPFDSSLYNWFSPCIQPSGTVYTGLLPKHPSDIFKNANDFYDMEQWRRIVT